MLSEFFSQLSSGLTTELLPRLVPVAVLAGLLVAWKLLRPVIALSLGPAIARRALAALPDQIHLVPAPESAWSKPEKRDRWTDELGPLGFPPAGDFLVGEMPGVRLRLFANEAESTYAVAYEHPQAGSWIEFACRFTDGTSCTWSNRRKTGLDPRPGHPVHYVPKATPAALWKSVQRERPAKPAQPAAPGAAAGDFERAYAESIAWRKGAGITRAEVARESMRKAA